MGSTVFMELQAERRWSARGGRRERRAHPLPISKVCTPRTLKLWEQPLSDPKVVAPDPKVVGAATFERRSQTPDPRPAAVAYLKGMNRLSLQGSGFRVQGSGCRVQGSGFRVQGSGFRVQGSGFRVQGSGFRVQGSGYCDTKVTRVVATSQKCAAVPRRARF